jgi:RNA polymerase sigma-70 factor (ECF subfamily)
MTTDASNTEPVLDDLDRYKNGDQPAFLRLWEHHHDVFAGWLRRHLGKDDHAAEDLLSDTAVKLITPAIRAKYDREKPWGGWAFKILRNLTIDFLRKRTRTGAVVFDTELHPDPDSCVDDDGLAESLHECLGALSARLRELMVQRYLEDRQQTDIAREMGLSTATVSKNLEKARTLLAQCLEDKGYGDHLR